LKTPEVKPGTLGVSLIQAPGSKQKRNCEMK
jgi:hypothetical protein